MLWDIPHRDLKPANIKVRPNGTVMVLDFGLAKALAGDVSGQDLSQSPTVTATVGGTREGVILGTAAYMSPEQARGQTLDKRTDIWSFGCVLYEMLTDRMAFGGDTHSDTMAAILEREPNWQALPSAASSALTGLLRRCLRKDHARRQRDLGDVSLELEELCSQRQADEEPSYREAQARRFPTLAWLYVVKPIRTTAAASQERLPAVVPRGAASSDSLSVVLVTFAA